MPDSGHYSRPEVMAMLDAPADVTDLLCGGIRVTKAGVVGIGATRGEAMIDWCHRFVEMDARSKPPTEEAPPA